MVEDGGGAPAGPGGGDDPRAAQRREFYELGRRVKDLMAGGMGRKPAARAVAAESGRPAALALKASAFAGRYSEADVARLELARTSEGRTLPVTVLARLGTVASPGDRDHLVAALGRGELNSETLPAAIRRRKGVSKSGGGPRRRRPRDPAEGLAQVREATREWLDRHDRAWAGQPWLAGPVADGAAAPLREVRAMLARLAAAAGELDRALERAGGEATGTTPAPADRPVEAAHD